MALLFEGGALLQPRIMVMETAAGKPETLTHILERRRELLQQWGGLRLRRQHDRALNLWPAASPL